jgi:hypothetical protein
MQRLEVSGAVRLICKSLGVKGLISPSPILSSKITKYKLQGHEKIIKFLPRGMDISHSGFGK